MRCFNPRVLLSSRGDQLSLFGPGRAAAADAGNVRGPSGGPGTLSCDEVSLILNMMAVIVII